MADNLNRIDNSPDSKSGFLDWLKNFDIHKAKKQLGILGLSLMITASAATMGGCGAKEVELPAPNEKPPVEEPQEIEKMPTVESLQISADLIDQPEELVQELFNKTMTNWENAGATKSNYKASLDYILDNIGATNEEFSNDLAPKYDELYIDALFPDDWESNPSLVSVVDVMSSIHQGALLSYINTSSPEVFSEDKVPYTRNVVCELLEVISSTDSTLIIRLSARDTDNADKNRVGEELTDGAKADPNDIAIHEFTLSVEDGCIKIVNDKIID